MCVIAGDMLDGPFIYDMEKNGNSWAETDDAYSEDKMEEIYTSPEDWEIETLWHFVLIRAFSFLPLYGLCFLVCLCAELDSHPFVTLSRRNWTLN